MTSFPILDLAKDAAELSPEAFGEKHGQAFFVFMESAMDLDDAMAPRSTLVTHGPGDPVLSQLHKFHIVSVPEAKAGAARALVVGRSEDCDVFLRHSSVSTEHAFITRENGEWVIHDNQSTNGTFVNEIDAPNLDGGVGLNLTPMARVRFGAFEVTFMDAGKVQAIARQAYKTPEPIF
jgi:hypothetical protein